MANQGDDNTRNQGQGGQADQAGQNQQGQGRDRQQEQAGDAGGQMGGGDTDNDNPGNFKNDPERASEAGRKGGESSGGGVR